MQKGGRPMRHQFSILFPFLYAYFKTQLYVYRFISIEAYKPTQFDTEDEGGRCLRNFDVTHSRRAYQHRNEFIIAN
jgi:hypothetical protein